MPNPTEQMFTPRTDAEIVARINEIKDQDFFGTETTELLARLPFIAARPFLLAAATYEDWEKVLRPNTRESILEEMRDYMTFAWDKATGHRGLSASRSIAHFCGWLYLLGEDELLEYSEHNYRPYGAPILARICERFGFTAPTDERALRMMRGESCRPDCDEGCSG